MSNEIALVTGASHGIGLEVCRQLAQRGMTVLLTARDEAKAVAAAQTLAATGVMVIPKVLNVNDETSIQQLAAAIQQEFGKLDVLINNAAVFSDWAELPSTADLPATRSVLETNLFAVWRISQVFLPLLRLSAHGRLVNVSSGAGSHADEQFGLTTNFSASYAISKAALNALTAKLAAEMKDNGLLINAVCPGFTATSPGMAEMGARPVQEGSASVVWAATLPKGGPTGGFFRDGQALPW